MRIDTVIWDLGGVLLRTENFSRRQALAERFGMERSDLERIVFDGEASDRAQLGEITYEQFGEHIQKTLGLSPEGWETFQEEFWGGDSIDEEMIAYIRRLQRGRYRTGLLSNAFTNLRPLLISEWKIIDAFDAIVISAEEKMVKPDTRIYQLALKRLQAAPEQAVFIDDVPANVEGARQVGMRAIQFRSASQVLNELEQVLDGKSR